MPAASTWAATVTTCRGSTRRRLQSLRIRIGMGVPDYNLFRHKTAIENILEGLLVVKRLPRPQAQDIAEGYLALMACPTRPAVSVLVSAASSSGWRSPPHPGDAAGADPVRRADQRPGPEHTGEVLGGDPQGGSPGIR